MAAARKSMIALLGLGVLLGIAAVVALGRRSTPPMATDAGTVDAPRITLGAVPFRKLPGLKRIEPERHPGPEPRLLLLGEHVHACEFDAALSAMSCAEIAYEPQYGPHDEPDVGLAETEAGAARWVIVPKRGTGPVPAPFFELEPAKRIAYKLMIGDAFVGADGRVALLENHIDDDQLVFGSPNELKRVKLPAPSGQTELVGEWLLWSDSGETRVTRARAGELEPIQTLRGKYARAACHAKTGSRLLGERDGKLVLFAERDGRWSILEGAHPKMARVPSTDRYRFEQDLTSLFCTERSTVVIAQDVKRLDPNRYLLELAVSRCDEHRCVAEAPTQIDLGSAGLAGKLRVVPVRDELLVLWMSARGVLRMTWVAQQGATPIREVSDATNDYLVGVWVRDDVAVALLTAAKQGVRGLRFGPDHDSVSALAQR